MTRRHPSYRNPTVVETIGEIHFTKEPFDPTSYGELLKRLGPDFPHMEPEPIVKIQSQVGPAELAQRVSVRGLRARYPHRDGGRIVQLAPGVLTVNILPPYPGWARALETMEHAWRTLVEVVHPSGARRLGLRYINRIPWAPGSPVSDWIAANDLVPPQLLAERERFVVRFERSPGSGHRIILSLGDALLEDGSSTLILDIDAILEADLANEWQEMGREVDALHEMIWEAFSVSCSARLRAYLEGEEES